MDNFAAPEPPARPSPSAIAHGVAFALLFTSLVVSPWAYGSWERWWFWPMFALLSAAGFFSGFGALIESVRSDEYADKLSGRFRCSRQIAMLGLCATPFFVYAVVRAQFPSGVNRPLVELPAERSLLLMFSPLLIAFVSFFSLTRSRVKILCVAIIVNILIIAFYSAFMMLVGKPDLVLWTNSPWDYGGRAKAPFFCPNHLSALLNFGICFFVARAFSVAENPRRRIAAAALAGFVFLADLLTLSRGGLISILLALAIGIPVFATRGRGLRLRIIAPVVSLAVLVGVVMLVMGTDNAFGNRVRRHPLYITAFPENKTAYEPGELCKRLRNAFWYGFDRGQYIDMALRAWRSNPVWGIGPGQHADRWGEFAATYVARGGEPVVRPLGGDYSVMRRPLLTNDTHRTFEVHSDWTQVLEEYGVVGFTLFLPPIILLLALLYGAQTTTLRKEAEIALKLRDDGDGDKEGENDDEAYERRRSRSRRSRSRRRVRDGYSDGPWRGNETPSAFELSLPLAGLLASLTLIIHSFGDFSLQMPSILWVFSFMLAAGVLTVTRTHR